MALFCWWFIINDLISIIDKTLSNRLLYADDTILYIASESSATSVENNQKVLNDVCTWCSYYVRLSVNIGKTKHMVVPSNRDNSVGGGQNNTICLKLNQVELENVHSYNYW